MTPARLLLAGLAILVTALALPSCGDTVHAAARRPPVVIIVIDTLRADHLACYGYELETSPEIDAFASTATVFEANSTQVNTTHASLTSILTGLYGRNHGNYVAVPAAGVSAREDVVSIASRLEPHGYQSMATISHPVLHLAPEGVDPFPGWRQLSTLEGHYDEMGTDATRADFVNERTFELLDRRTDEPLLLWVHYFDPHTDGTWYYDAPEETRDLFLHHHLAEANALQYEAALRELEPAERDEWIRETVPGPDREAVRIANGRALYDAEIRFCDRHVGELLDRLVADGVYDDALIAVLADHGENLEPRSAGHGVMPFTHHDLYEAVTHVPLIVKLPGQHEGCRVSAMTQSIDLLPTILEVLDVPAEPAVDGKSLLALLDGQDGEIHERVYTEASRDSAIGVRSPEHKLIHRREDGASRLFAWRDDPDELHDRFQSVDDRVRDALVSWAREFEVQPALRIRVVPDPELGPLELELRSAPDTIYAIDGPTAERGADDRSLRWTIPASGDAVELGVLLEHDQQELRWTLRRPGDEHLVERVRIGSLPLQSSTAVPLWIGVDGDPVEPIEFAVDHDEARSRVDVQLRPRTESFVELDVRYRRPGNAPKMSLIGAEGWSPTPMRHRVNAAATTSEPVSAKVRIGGKGTPILVVPRIDGRWPRRDRVRIGDSQRLPLDEVQFVFSFPPDQRLNAQLSAAPPADGEPGSILIWSETMTAGAIDASRLDPEVARALNALGYVDDEALEGR